ncbi:thymidylate synthase [Chelonobacter oris]|uniref:thymidylate synthase n=1 Tax=Chelonobacter oris TaxID=505317 RepID=UPI002446FE1F|nr:thymidylate synthase [Chelonobacter oris]MDH3001423.1 thymidylate synthase [Chelonobacter oris]
MIETINIIKDSVDELVVEGCKFVIKNGVPISSKAGDALQCYNVNYILTNPRNRVHTLRKQAKKYLCNELIAYFNGSLYVADGLGKASKFWYSLADEEGKINSNYGFYIFHEPPPIYESQYLWALNSLQKNIHSRRAIININQAYHKDNTKDFPCTTAILFFIKDNKLFCDVLSRSTDLVTGLPYDIGFFSLVHELLYQNLIDYGMNDLELGYTTMKTSFTQIYNKTMDKANYILENQALNKAEFMPKIDNANKTLYDIYHKTQHTEIMKWIIENAE